MRHIFIIETAGIIGPIGVTALRMAIADAVDEQLGAENNVVLFSCNHASAIRAVYRLYHADESLSPDELGSAK